MQTFFKIFVLTWLCAYAQANPHTLDTKEITEIHSQTDLERPVGTDGSVEVVPPIPIEDQTVTEQKRDRRQLIYPNHIIAHDALPQQTNFLPGLAGGSLPIVGTLINGLPLIGSAGGLLGTLPAQLGNTLNGITGSLGLGNLASPGGLLNLNGLLQGGLLATPGVTASCPASQKLNCRCESILPIKAVESRRFSSLYIVKQNQKHNEDGSTEFIAELSNGITMYQKSDSERLPAGEQSNVKEGYYSLKFGPQRYLTVYYSINDIDYTVKADVSTELPQIELSF